MPDYMFAYHGGTRPESPEECTQQIEKWKRWIEGLGDTILNPGTPLGMSKTVTREGVENNGGLNPLSGFSIIKADNIDEAAEIAKTCPFIELDTASIEIAEMKEMQP